MAENSDRKLAVAVCLAAFNGMQFLQQQVDSIFEQVHVDVTLYVSVDRSTDGTEQWFRDLQSHDKRVTLLPYGAQFGGAASNFFRLLRDVDFSGFDCVAFADQDDIWLPEKLSRAAQCMQTTHADGYSSDIIAFWSSGRNRYIKKSFPQRRWDYLFESAGPGCTFVMNGRLTMDLQHFLQTHLEQMRDVGLHDWFTYAYARAHGYVWHIDEYAGLMYRQHDGNQVGVNSGVAAFLWRVGRVLNGWGLNQARMIADLVAVGGQTFVRRWHGGGRRSMLALAWQASQCRRKPVDRIWFAASCIALAVVGWK